MKDSEEHSIGTIHIPWRYHYIDYRTLKHIVKETEKIRSNIKLIDSYYPIRLPIPHYSRPSRPNVVYNKDNQQQQLYELTTEELNIIESLLTTTKLQFHELEVPPNTTPPPQQPELLRTVHISSLQQQLESFDQYFYRFLDYQLFIVNSHYQYVSGYILSLENKAKELSLTSETEQDQQDLLYCYEQCHQLRDLLRSYTQTNYNLCIKALKSHDKLLHVHGIGSCITHIHSQPFYSLIDRTLPYAHSTSKEYNLRIATQQGDVEATNIEIITGADINAPNPFDGTTPLMVAAVNGHINCTELLLQSKADINAVNHNGTCALTHAIINNHSDVAEILIRYGANLDLQDQGSDKTPLMYASLKGMNNIVSLLLENNANPSLTDRINQTALLLACENGQSECVQSLLHYKSSILHQNDLKQNSISAAASGNHVKCLQILLKSEQAKTLLEFGSGNIHLMKKDQQLLGTLMDNNEQQQTQQKLTKEQTHAEQTQHNESLRQLLQKMQLDVDLTLPTSALPIVAASVRGNIAALALLLKVFAKWHPLHDYEDDDYDTFDNNNINEQDNSDDDELTTKERRKKRKEVKNKRLQRRFLRLQQELLDSGVDPSILQLYTNNFNQTNDDNIDTNIIHTNTTNINNGDNEHDDNNHDINGNYLYGDNIDPVHQNKIKLALLRQLSSKLDIEVINDNDDTKNIADKPINDDLLQSNSNLMDSYTSTISTPKNQTNNDKTVHFYDDKNELEPTLALKLSTSSNQPRDSTSSNHGLRTSGTSGINLYRYGDKQSPQEEQLQKMQQLSNFRFTSLSSSDDDGDDDDEDEDDEEDDDDIITPNLTQSVQHLSKLTSISPKNVSTTLIQPSTTIKHSSGNNTTNNNSHDDNDKNSSTNTNTLLIPQMNRNTSNNGNDSSFNSRPQTPLVQSTRTSFPTPIKLKGGNKSNTEDDSPNNINLDDNNNDDSNNNSNINQLTISTEPLTQNNSSSTATASSSFPPLPTRTAKTTTTTTTRDDDDVGMLSPLVSTMTTITSSGHHNAGNKKTTTTLTTTTTTSKSTTNNNSNSTTTNSTKQHPFMKKATPIDSKLKDQINTNTISQNQPSSSLPPTSTNPTTSEQLSPPNPSSSQSNPVFETNNNNLPIHPIPNHDSNASQFQSNDSTHQSTLHKSTSTNNISATVNITPQQQLASTLHAHSQSDLPVPHHPSTDLHLTTTPPTANTVISDGVITSTTNGIRTVISTEIVAELEKKNFLHNKNTSTHHNNIINSTSTTALSDTPSTSTPDVNHTFTQNDQSTSNNNDQIVSPILVSSQSGHKPTQLIDGKNTTLSSTTQNQKGAQSHDGIVISNPSEQIIATHQIGGLSFTSPPLVLDIWEKKRHEQLKIDFTNQQQLLLQQHQEKQQQLEQGLLQLEHDNTTTTITTNTQPQQSSFKMKKFKKPKKITLIRTKIPWIDIRDKYGCSALLRAAEYRHLDIMKLLLKHGANPNITRLGGRLCITNYQDDDDEDISMKKIVSRSYTYSGDLSTSLMLCANHNNIEAVELLLQYKANIDIQRLDGTTALLCAADRGYYQVVELLLKHGANVNLANIHGYTPLVRCAVATYSSPATNYKRCMELLLKYKANFNNQTLNGSTALILASTRSAIPCIESLLQQDSIDLDIQDNEQCTALMRASMWGHVEVIELLLEAKADMNKRDYNGRSALHLASGGGYYRSVKLLLQYGADWTLTDNNGITARELATHQNHVTLLALFKEYEKKYNLELKQQLQQQQQLQLQQPQALIKVDSTDSGTNTTTSTSTTTTPATSNTPNNITNLNNNNNVSTLNINSNLLHQQQLSNHPNNSTPLSRNFNTVGTPLSRNLSLIQHKSNSLQYSSIFLPNNNNNPTTDQTTTTSAETKSDTTLINDASQSTQQQQQLTIIDDQQQPSQRQSFLLFPFEDCSSLRKAATNGDIERLKHIIATHETRLHGYGFGAFTHTGPQSALRSWVDLPDQFGNTALILACAHGRMQCTTILLQNTFGTCNVNTKNSFGRNALMSAARKGYSRCVNQILEMPTLNVGDVDELGHSVVHLVAKKGHTRVLLDLCQYFFKSRMNHLKQKLMQEQKLNAMNNDTPVDQIVDGNNILTNIPEHTTHNNNNNHNIEQQHNTHHNTSDNDGDNGDDDEIENDHYDQNEESLALRFYHHYAVKLNFSNPNQTNPQQNQQQNQQQNFINLHQSVQPNPKVTSATNISKDIVPQITSMTTFDNTTNQKQSTTSHTTLNGDNTSSSITLQLFDLPNPDQFKAKLSQNDVKNENNTKLATNNNNNPEDDKSHLYGMIYNPEDENHYHNDHENASTMLDFTSVGSDDIHEDTDLHNSPRLGSFSVSSFSPSQSSTTTNFSQIFEQYLNQVNFIQLSPYFTRLINQFNIQNETPLFLAASNGHLNAVELLLKHGAEPDLVYNNRHLYPHLFNDVQLNEENHHNENEFYDTPLITACLNGYTDIVKLLLQYSSDPHFVGTSLTALNAACLSGHHEIVEVLLEHHVNIEAKDRFGSTALIRAVRQGHLDCVVSLLRHKVNVNALGESGTTALITCCLEYHSKSLYICRALLLAKANVNCRGEGGSTALLHAADKGFSDLVELLLQNNADTEICNIHGHTPLMRTVYWNRNTWDNGPCMALLLKAKANVHHIAEHGNTTLHIASHRAFTDAIIMLINHGANVNAINNEGITPLMRASAWGFISPIQALLYGGAENHLVDKFGRTALFHAVSLNRLDAVRILLEWKSPWGTKAYNNKTPLDIAREREFGQIVALLESYMLNVVNCGNNGPDYVLNQLHLHGINNNNNNNTHNNNGYNFNHTGTLIENGSNYIDYNSIRNNNITNLHQNEHASSQQQQLDNNVMNMQPHQPSKWLNPLQKQFFTSRAQLHPNFNLNNNPALNTNTKGQQPSLIYTHSTATQQSQPTPFPPSTPHSQTTAQFPSQQPLNATPTIFATAQHHNQSQNNNNSQQQQQQQPVSIAQNVMHSTNLIHDTTKTPIKPKVDIYNTHVGKSSTGKYSNSPNDVNQIEAPPVPLSNLFHDPTNNNNMNLPTTQQPSASFQSPLSSTKKERKAEKKRNKQMQQQQQQPAAYSLSYHRPQMSTPQQQSQTNTPNPSLLSLNQPVLVTAPMNHQQPSSSLSSTSSQNHHNNNAPHHHHQGYYNNHNIYTQTTNPAETLNNNKDYTNPNYTSHFQYHQLGDDSLSSTDESVISSYSFNDEQNRKLNQTSIIPNNSHRNAIHQPQVPSSSSQLYTPNVNSRVNTMNNMQPYVMSNQKLPPQQTSAFLPQHSYQQQQATVTTTASQPPPITKPKFTGTLTDMLNELKLQSSLNRLLTLFDENGISDPEDLKFLRDADYDVLIPMLGPRRKIQRWVEENL